MSIRVGLVDDHTIVRQGLAALLNREITITVVGEACTGLEAIDLAAELEPDVMIMDVGMGKLNGIEAARRIRSTHPQVQVVILSMHHTPLHIQRALKADVRAYLLKGEAAEQVVRAVHDAHAGVYFINEQFTQDLVRRHKTGAVDPSLNLLEKLSEREREVLQLVVEGETSRSIGERLSLSPSSVDTYRSRMMEKLEVSDRAALVKLAIQLGVTQLG